MSSDSLKLRYGANVLLFSVTLAELTFLLLQTPTFTFVDWIYVSQHLLILVIAFTRRQPVAKDYGEQHLPLQLSPVTRLPDRPPEPSHPAAGPRVKEIGIGCLPNPRKRRDRSAATSGDCDGHDVPGITVTCQDPT